MDKRRKCCYRVMDVSVGGFPLAFAALCAFLHAPFVVLNSWKEGRKEGRKECGFGEFYVTHRDSFLK